MSISEGTHYVHESLEFWAENGLIYVEDHRDDCEEDKRFTVMTVRDCLQRAAVLSVEARRISARIRASVSSSGNKIAAEDRRKLQDCIEHMVEASKQARRQGDPGDPATIEQMRRQRKKHLLLPGKDVSDPKKLLLGDGTVSATKSKAKRPLWAL